MSELNEAAWAVVSERGLEASDLKHEEALDLMRRLVQKKVYGLCIVTAAAARRAAPPAPAANQSVSSSTARRER